MVNLTILHSLTQILLSLKPSIKKNGVPRQEPRTPRCLIFTFTTYNSEVVLESQFTAQTEIVVVFGRQEGNLAICTQCIADGDTQTCFARELSVSLFAVNGNNSRACLDVVGSSTNFSFVVLRGCRSSRRSNHLQPNQHWFPR